jgi:LacI family transcriptional regulator
MKTKPAVTIRQLASQAGVSRTTVSLALRHHPSIPDETRDKILKVAEKMGYRPDPVVSTLMNHLRVQRSKRVTEKIAYLTFWREREKWKTNVNELGYFTGCTERASQLGYELEHFWAKEPGINASRLSKILYSRGVRGVILAPLPIHLGHVSLEWDKLACVALGLTILKPNLHRVSHNYHEGMVLALRMLKHHGYQRFGFVNWNVYNRRARYGWLSGFLTYLHQFQPNTELHIPPLIVEKWSKLEFNRWLKRYQPDVLLSNTQEAMELAQEAGLRVPEDIGYVCLHRLRPTDPWAGIHRFPEQIGAAAVDLLVSQLQSNELGLPAFPKTVSIEGTWQDGPTIRHLGKVK